MQKSMQAGFRPTGKDRKRASLLGRLRPGVSAGRELVPRGFHSRHQHDSRWTTEATATVALTEVVAVVGVQKIQNERTEREKEIDGEGEKRGNGGGRGGRG